MALFESYERRIDKINSVLNSYGIASIEELRKSQKTQVLMYTIRSKAFSNLFRERLLGIHSRCCNRNQKRMQESSRCSSSYR